MDRTERFYKITELLRSYSVSSVATLLATLEMSRSTLKSNLKHLCERLNNSLVFCQELEFLRDEEVSHLVSLWRLRLVALLQNLWRTSSCQTR